jgi:hypothetical protein
LGGHAAAHVIAEGTAHDVRAHSPWFFVIHFIARSAIKHFTDDDTDAIATNGAENSANATTYDEQLIIDFCAERCRFHFALINLAPSNGKLSGPACAPQARLRGSAPMKS